MRRLLEGRITEPGWKVMYVLGVWFLGIPLLWIVPSLPVLDEVLGALTNATTLALIWFGARVFRGRGEPVAPDRAWWRFTAWPTLSWVLGLTFLAIVVASTFNPNLALVDLTHPGWWILLVSATALAIAYLNSAVRLTVAGIRRPRRTRELLTPPTLT